MFWRYLTGLLFCSMYFIGFNAVAQSVVTNKGIFQVSNGTILSINGDYVHDSDTAELNVDDTGLLILTGNMVNQSSSSVTNGATGRIELKGTSQQLIDRSSGGTILFHDLTLNNPAGFLINGGIHVMRNLELQEGVGDLDTSKLELISDGQLLSETGDNRISATTGSLKTDFRDFIGGEIDNYKDIANLGAEISIPGFPGGQVLIERAHQQHPANSNNESILRSFRIVVQDFAASPFSSAPAQLKFNYFDSELGSIGSEENSFTLFQSIDNGITWMNRGGVVNTGSNYLELSGINNINGIWTVSYCVPPTVSLGDDIFLCPQGESTLTANTAGTSPFTYAWLEDGVAMDGEISTSLGIVVGQDAVQYSVIATDAKGCSGVDALDIDIHPLPVIELGADVSSCTNEEAEIDARPGFTTYQWLDSANQPIGNEQIYSATAEGKYKVIVTNGVGCENKDSVNVLHKSIPQTDLPSTSSTCGDQMIIGTGLSDLNPDATFIWRDSQGTAIGAQPALTVFEEGLYQVLIIAGNGCEISSATTVILNSADLVNLGVDKRICANTGIFLDASRANSSYLWSTGETSEAITYTIGSANALVWVEITDLASLCAASDTIMIESEALPALDLGADRQICENTETTLDAGDGFMSYAWNDGSSGKTLTVSEMGTYSVEVTNDFGCENTDEIEIGIFDPIEFNFTSKSATCGTEIELGIGLESLNPGASFAWSNGATTPTITVNDEANYSVTITDVNGCIKTDSTMVVLNATNFVDLGPDISLECQSVTIDAGNPGSTYEWSNDSESQSIDVDDPGTYSVTVTNPFGCIDSDEVTVILLPALDSAFFLSATEAGVNDTIFFIGLTTAATTSIRWDFDDAFIEEGNSTLASHAFTSAGEFDPRMITTFTNGCIDDYSKHVIITEKKEGDSGGRAVQQDIITNVSIYPNPNDGRFRVAVELSHALRVGFAIVNMTGNPLATLTTATPASTHEIDFDIRSTVIGVYVLVIQAGKETREYRIVKTK